MVSSIIYRLRIGRIAGTALTKAVKENRIGKTVCIKVGGKNVWLCDRETFRQLKSTSIAPTRMRYAAI